MKNDNTAMINNIDKEVWVYDREVHDLKYPAENVIRFLAHNRSMITPGAKILDFGCGSGRNTKLMADLGLEIYAMDCSADCLNLTAQKLNGYHKVHYIENNGLDVPLEKNSMDCIVAWGALFLLPHAEEERLFENLVRTLTPGGLMLADYRTKEDSFYGQGTKIEKDVYRLDDSCGSLSGITYAFKDLEEIRKLYEKNKLQIINYEKLDYYVENCQNCNSHYIIWSRKEVE